MATTSNGTPVFDGDSHVWEPHAVWAQYLDAAYRVPARSAFWYEETEFGTRCIVNGKLLPAPRSRLNREALWSPGMTEDDVAELDPSQPHPLTPGAQDPQARLRDMDAMGIDQALIFPTIFAEHFPQVENPDVAYALARAYNDWILDFCRANPNRLFPAAILPVQEIGFAVEELRRVAAQGIRAAFLRPSYYNDRFLNHPYYDPLWRELEQLGVAAAFHPSRDSVSDPEWASHAPFIERVSRPFGTGHTIASNIAPSMDNSLALHAFLAFAHFDRFPELRAAWVHGKGSWLPLLLEKSEGYLTIAPRTTIPVRPQSIEVFYESKGMVGFEAGEYVVGAMYDEFENKGIWGSHYPSQETTTAGDARRKLAEAGVPEDVVAKLMGANAARTYNVKRERLIA